jgi:DNA repair protein RecN (Recombination protein N)
MLRYVNIRNLAVIESLEVTFQQGLNVITGETGAGKSIVVGAVGLLLGDDPDRRRNGDRPGGIRGGRSRGHRSARSHRAGAEPELR